MPHRLLHNKEKNHKQMENVRKPFKRTEPTGKYLSLVSPFAGPICRMLP